MAGRPHLCVHLGISYLAMVFDPCTRRVVGASNMRQPLVSDGLEMVLSARREHDSGLVARSNKAPQYTPCEYTKRLKRAGHRLEQGTHSHGARRYGG